MEARYRDQYQSLWREHWWWQARQRLVTRVIGETFAGRTAEADSGQPRIFDIGCAGGLAFDDWSRFGEVFGLEPDDGLLDAESPWSSRIERAAFGADYRASRRYDLAIMLDVLEHIEDDAGAMRSLFRLLKPGGIAVATVPAFQLLWSRHDDANLHFRRYTRRSLLAVAEAAGFAQVRSFYFFSWSFPLVYLRKWLSRGRAESYQVRVPPPLVNATFRQLTLWEDWLRSRWRIAAPWGSSLLAVLQRPVTVQEADTDEAVAVEATACVG